MTELEMTKPPPRKAVIYARVSTIKQVREGDGLRSQERYCRDYARHRNLSVEHVFVDSMSGQYAERPGMDEMLGFLRKQRSENYVVLIDDISRLARNIVAHIELRSEIAAAGGELMSASMELSDDPIAQLPEKMMAVMVEHARIENADRSAKRMRARLLNGYWVFCAPAGYKYEKSKEGGKQLVRKEPEASVLSEALEGFANGRFDSQIEVKRFLDAHPDYPVKRQGGIHLQRIRELLTRPHYAGYIHYPAWNVPLTRAKHAPLISYETYERIQDRLNGKARAPVRKDVNSDFPLRGFVLCGDCGTPYRGGWSKGRNKSYAYYNCQAKGCASYGKSVKKEVMEGEFEQLLQTLRPSTHLFKAATRMLDVLWRKYLKGFEAQKQSLTKQLESLETQSSNLVQRLMAASQPAVISAYEGELTRIEAEKTVLEDRLAQESTKTPPTFKDGYRTAMTFLANPCYLWKTGGLAEQRTVLKLAFADHLTYIRGKGYRTAKTTLPFSVLGEFESPESSMAPEEDSNLLDNTLF